MDKRKANMSVNYQELHALYKAIQTIGKDKRLRERLIAELKEIESTLNYPSGNIREDITGPIADALHGSGKLMKKKLSSGLIFQFRYSSKIARDFVLSDPDMPDHVWEPQTTKLLLYLSRRANNVIVGGAYFGDQAILIAKELSMNGGVCHAFEPDRKNFSMLLRNAQSNLLDNIKAYPLGLWSDENTLLHLVGHDAYATSEPITGAEGLLPKGVGTLSIDRYIKEQRIGGQVELIMLDIEGAEYEALQGAENQLSLPVTQAPSVIFEVHNNYVDWSKGLENTDILRFLRSKNYEIYAIRDFHSNYNMAGKPVELIPADRTYIDGPPHGFNMVAIKDTSILKNDLIRFCHDVSPKLLVHKDPKLHHPIDGL